MEYSGYIYYSCIDAVYCGIAHLLKNSFAVSFVGQISISASRKLQWIFFEKVISSACFEMIRLYVILLPHFRQS